MERERGGMEAVHAMHSFVCKFDTTEQIQGPSFSLSVQFALLFSIRFAYKVTIIPVTFQIFIIALTNGGIFQKIATQDRRIIFGFR